MMTTNLKTIIQNGENLTIEFKESRSKLNKDIFTTTIILNDQANDHVSDQADEMNILTFCTTPKSINKIMSFVGMNHKTYFRKNVLNPLIQKGLISPTIPDKPKSPNQKYVSLKNRD